MASNNPVLIAPPNRAKRQGVPTFDKRFITPPPSETSATSKWNRYKHKILNQYRYSDLESRHDLRLLLIEPAGDFNHPLFAQLVPIALEDPDRIKYEALSYFWGDDEADKELKIIKPMYQSKSQAKSSITDAVFTWKEGKTMYIRQNLDSALRHLRLPNQVVPLWVDAICINQNDTKERNDQVAKMQHIYNHAENVCIWLGARTDTSDMAIDFIGEIINLEKFDSLVKGSELPKYKVPEKWNALARVMENQWFSRRWVVQELTHAKQATIHYGYKEIHWSDFADATALFSTRFDEIKEAVRLSRAIKDRDPLGDIRVLGANSLVTLTTRLFRKSPEGMILEKLLSLDNLVSSLLAFEASEPRDIVYAVLSLAKDHYRIDGSEIGEILGDDNSDAGQKLPEHIRPDYDKPLVEVLLELVQFCVNSSKSLDIICRHWAPTKPATATLAITKDATMPEALVLPSWMSSVSESAFGAPGNLNGRANGDCLVGTESDRPIYNASLGFEFFPQNVGFDLAKDIIPKGPNTSNTSGCPSLAVISMPGYRIGSIKKTSNPCIEGIIPREAMEMGGYQFDLPADRISEVTEELWRTMVADRGPDRNNPPGWYHRAAEWALAHSTPSRNFHTPWLEQYEHCPKMMRRFLKRVQDVVWNRRFFQYSNKMEDFLKDSAGSSPYFGLGPSGIQAEDIVCIIPGCTIPVILREYNASKANFSVEDSKINPSEEHHFKLVGECYIYGFMDGEVYEAYKNKRMTLEEEIFNIY